MRRCFLICLHLHLLGRKNRPNRIGLAGRQGLDGQAGIQARCGLIGQPADQPVAGAGELMRGIEQAWHLARIVSDQPPKRLVKGQLSAGEPGRFGREIHPGRGGAGQLIKHGGPG